VWTAGWVVVRSAHKTVFRSESAAIAVTPSLATAGRRGDRDWFHGPPDRFFRFFTTPPITVYIPDESGVEYGHTVFRRL
jgi:hypothetical protein